MKPLTAGSKAPEFTLPDQHGTLVRLHELLTRGPVVLFFYPLANSSGCTAEVCHFRDLAGEFAAAGAQRVGISRDSSANQKRFVDGQRLDYPLLADEDGTVCAAYGVKRGPVWRKIAPVKRVTFVIDTDGTIRRTIGSETSMSVHADDALAALQD